MCNPYIAAAATIAGTGMQVKAAKDEGKAAAEVAKINAAQNIIDKEQNDLDAKQMVNDRLAQLDRDMEINNALFAFANRSDASVETFKKAETDIAYQDVERGITLDVLRGNQSMMAATQEIRRGQMQKKAASYQSASMMASGLYQLTQIKYT
jgi:hypothetical protein